MWKLDYGSRKYKRFERSFEECKVAQDRLRQEQRDTRNARLAKEREERNKRWEEAREESNPDGFCIPPETNSSITQLSYSSCRLLTTALGRTKTEQVYASSTSASKNRVSSLKQLCEEGVIKPSLKAPSTAIFSDGKTLEVSQGVYLVNGKVDAQNGYGAMLRNNYTCYFSHTDNNFDLVYNYLR
ncbi:hypothetical protein IQ255_24690 [Pleurocapsales cyanobacterium LEGE 10410]|nr:hypothetical protein [Pleurocapsales cyanobacterium LEGE 10410]